MMEANARPSNCAPIGSKPAIAWTNGWPSRNGISARGRPALVRRGLSPAVIRNGARGGRATVDGGVRYGLDQRAVVARPGNATIRPILGQAGLVRRIDDGDPVIAPGSGGEGDVGRDGGRRADLMVDVVVGDQILQALLVEMVVAAQFEAIAQGQDIEFELAALAVVGLVLVLS